MLTKLSVAAMTLAFGAITAAALVPAQSIGGPQDEPKRPAGRSACPVAPVVRTAST